jgi:hypothetical protein
VKDPFFVLPILMGASMWYLQKMSPTTITDPMQQKVMQFMPIIFTFMFLWFGRSDSVLAGEQRHLHHPADHHLSSAGKERPALTQLMRSPSFLMTKRRPSGRLFYYNVPTPLTHSANQRVKQDDNRYHRGPGHRPGRGGVGIVRVSGLPPSGSPR